MNTVENIFRLLEEKGKTQRELAEYLGVNESAISNWKNGKFKSYNRRLNEIAAFFDVPLPEVIGYSSAETQGVVQNKNANTSYAQVSIQNQAVFPSEIQKLYNGLSLRSKLEVQTFIVDKSEEEKGNK